MYHSTTKDSERLQDGLLDLFPITSRLPRIKHFATRFDRDKATAAKFIIGRFIFKRIVYEPTCHDSDTGHQLGPCFVKREKCEALNSLPEAKGPRFAKA